jgi:hypothetical protein
MKAKESFPRRTCVLWAAMLAVLFGVRVLLVPVATTKRYNSARSTTRVM